MKGKPTLMSIQKSNITIALAFALVGCYGATHQVSEHRYPPTAVGSVQVLYQEPKRPYEVLAFMNHRDTVTLSLKAQINALRKQAAELGADAVVITQAQGLMFGSLQGVNAAGKAIRWTR
jgi:hypothetical protein